MDVIVYFFKLALRWFFDPLYSRSLVLISLRTTHDKRIAFSKLPEPVKREILQTDNQSVVVVVQEEGKLCISGSLVYFKGMRVLPDRQINFETPTISIDRLPIDAKIRIYLATPRSTTLDFYEGNVLSVLSGHAYYNGHRVIE